MDKRKNDGLRQRPSPVQGHHDFGVGSPQQLAQLPIILHAEDCEVRVVPLLGRRSHSRWGTGHLSLRGHGWRGSRVRCLRCCNIRCEPWSMDGPLRGLGLRLWGLLREGTVCRRERRLLGDRRHVLVA